MIAEAPRLNETFASIMVSSEHICVSNPDSLPEQVCFFSDINEQGDVTCLQPFQVYDDLTRVGRHKVGWWYTRKATPHDNVVVHGGWESRSEAIV
jgi:hypothetical protein